MGLEELATRLDKWVAVDVVEVIGHKGKCWLVCEGPGVVFNLELPQTLDDVQQYLGGTVDDNALFVWVKDNAARAISFDKRLMLMVNHRIA